MRRKKAAFTLVELLVAAAITVTLAVVMVGIVGRILSAWNRSSGALQGHSQATLALGILTRDLQSVVIRPTQNVWLAATVQGDQVAQGDTNSGFAQWTSAVAKPGMANPGTSDSSLWLSPPNLRLEDYRFGMAGVWLRMICHVPDNNTVVSDVAAPRAVSYQIVRHRIADQINASQRYALVRSEVRPSHSSVPEVYRSTFAVGYDLFSPAYNDPDSVVGPTVSGSGLGDPGTIRRPMRTHVLAMNVVDFGVRLFARDSAGSPVLVFPVSDTNLGFAATTHPTALPPAIASPSHTYGLGEFTRGIPVIAEVFMRVLSDEGARQIEALEAGLLVGPTWWEIAEANSIVFTRRIELHSSPL